MRSYFSKNAQTKNKVGHIIVTTNYECEMRENINWLN